MNAPQVLSLTLRKVVRAPAARVFAAWTDAGQITRWFGPRDVRCIGAEVDLRVGGSYRIGNALPDGREVWIAGEFTDIAPPHRLVYTWRIEPEIASAEQVTVLFEPRGPETEVIVRHERIPSAAMRDSHAAGWEGCLDGLARYLQG